MDSSIRRKVWRHCWLRILSPRHGLVKGWQVGKEIIYCKCGYYLPRINSRGEESFVHEKTGPIHTKFLTETKVDELLKDFKE